jgi:hypothetical protein
MVQKVQKINYKLMKLILFIFLLLSFMEYTISSSLITENTSFTTNSSSLDQTQTIHIYLNDDFSFYSSNGTGTANDPFIISDFSASSYDNYN